MVKAAGTEDVIERFRVMIDPQRYRGHSQQLKDELVSRGEQIAIEIDLSENDPMMNPEERSRVLGQLRQTLESIVWRIDELDDVVKSFDAGEQAGMNRKMRRALLKEAKKGAE